MVLIFVSLLVALLRISLMLVLLMLACACFECGVGGCAVVITGCVVCCITIDSNAGEAVCITNCGYDGVCNDVG